jgi:hypothetical protein
LSKLEQAGLAKRAVARVREHERDDRRLERQSVTALALLCRARAQELDGRLRQSGEAPFVVEQKLERVGRVENVLREAVRDDAEVAIDLGEPLLAGRVEQRTLATEVGERLFE